MAPGLHAQNKASQKTAAEPIVNNLQSRPFASGSDREQQTPDSTAQTNSASNLSHNLSNISILPPASASTQPIQLMPFATAQPDLLKRQSSTPIGDHRVPVPTAAISHDNDGVINEQVNGQLPQQTTPPVVAATPKKTGMQKLTLKNTFMAPVSTQLADNSREQMSLPQKATQVVGRTVGFIPSRVIGAGTLGVKTLASHATNLAEKVKGSQINTHGKWFDKTRTRMEVNKDHSAAAKQHKKDYKNDEYVRTQAVEKLASNNIKNPSVEEINTETIAQKQRLKEKYEHTKDFAKFTSGSHALKVILDPRKAAFYGNKPGNTR